MNEKESRYRALSRKSVRAIMIRETRNVEEHEDKVYCRLVDLPRSVVQGIDNLKEHLVFYRKSFEQIYLLYTSEKEHD